MTILTVFRSRLRPEAEAAYHTLVLFSDSFSHAAWRDHPRHREAQDIGKQSLYSEYQIYSAEIDYAMSFSHDAVS